MRLGAFRGAARRVDAATALFVVALTLSGILLLVWLGHLTFFGDDWDPLLDRPGLSVDVLLRPHLEHILLGPVLIYKGIQATFGMESLRPYAVVSTAAFCASVVLLFVYLRRRLGGWLALAGALLVLFMGGAWEVLLWPFEVSFTVAMAAGIGALLALERRDGRGDAIACGLLVVAFAFSELALSFTLGVAVILLFDRSGWRRFYVIALPLLLYVGWYAGWGHTAQSNLSFHNVIHSPSYVLHGIAASIGALLGVSALGSTGSGWAALGAVVLIAAAVLRMRSPVPLPHAFWAALAILLSFWFLAGASAGPGREPHASRYQYVGGMLLLLAVGWLISGIRVRPLPTAIVLALAAAASISSAVSLHDNYTRLAQLATKTRGALAGIEVAGARADPNLILGPDNTDITNLNSLQVGPYLSAVSAYGSPAYDTTELAGAPEEARAAADQTLALTELPMGPPGQRVPVGGQAPALVEPARAGTIVRGGCLTLREIGGVTPLFTLPHPGALLRTSPGSQARLELRRFSMGFAVSRPLAPQEVIFNPTDSSMRPWQARIIAATPVTVCGLPDRSG